MNNNIYIANSLGLNILSTISNIVIEQPVFSYLDNSSVYDINISDNKLLIASEIGLFRYDYQLNTVGKIADDKYFKIVTDKNNNFIASRRNRLYKISNNRELLFSSEKIKNISICDDYVWINNIHEATILNLKNNKIVIYNQADGIIGDRINHLDCDDSWVWFSTNKGISMYNWSRYHYHEE